MGVNFRTSASNGGVWVGKRTVKEGESLGVWDMRGNYRVVQGPQREWMCWSRYVFMDRHYADPHQYLVVKYRDGKKDHVRGPVALFADPVKHARVEVHDAVTVDAFEVIVVYTEDATGRVKRDIVHGPTIFIPAVNQWLHVFKWHGSNGGDQYTKVPGALVFTKLRTIADQFYYNAVGVRTADDASLTIKVMVFFALDNLEAMLNSTHDPIGDFINALLADVMNFGSRHTYESFIGAAQQLSELASFPVLTQRAAAIGYKVSKVVYRGYTASSALQDLCDRAIRTRTELRLKQEEQEQAQRLRDMDLRSSLARGEDERAQEAARQAHRAKMEQADQAALIARQAEAARAEVERERGQWEAALAQEQARFRAQMEQAAQREAAEQAARDQAAAGQLTFLKGLAGLGVDVTRYLVAAADAGRQPDRVLKVVGLPEGGALHVNA
mmetsp:Transcript_7300/g.18091  ORF Transcript_7300/g.18091 Transcript_7300/m.18091 type:complete len:441 (-) Transcript_7300:398-1720(-)|eukprot:CAMPEP_0202866330 /NCGR_PEP_ID=MMETSP1391-20130828/7323_1 /ASSEMBLY_ACC=CAM_ASM_000867 /TAXON_ID=1034604 /ORGANISM="Chlamydomonas leiostraca, Strain SAG 11-49" /LENGTH=440 /DNA_ID=CAMNT_0049546263 /DNA_START=116 /DNA_END=1438 /DNA_ORIENTATION=+